MKVTIVGAGPAGLYLGVLLKSLRPDFGVAIVERRARGARPGLGITLPAYAVAMITRADPSPTLATALTAPWSSAEIHVNRQRFTFPFGELVGVSRADLVGYLERRCEEAGVTLRFGERVGPAEVTRMAAESDVLVGADGAGSAVRARHAAAFGAVVDDGPNLFAWLAAGRGLPQMRIGFQQLDAGMLVCASYPYAADRSTFIVECSPRVWSSLGMEARRDGNGNIDSDGLALIARHFEGLLEGAPLVDVRASWRHFRSVRVRRLHVENVALIGDAAATMYYSFGAGTPLALRSAATLAGALCAEPDPARALRTYEEHTRDPIEEARRAAETDMHSVANLDAAGTIDPAAFARAYVSRFD